MQKMKKILYAVATTLMVALFFGSCTGLFGGKDFDAELLYRGSGLWRSTEKIAGVSTTVMRRWASDGSGKEWYPDQDVQESEALAFTWELNSDDLSLRHYDPVLGKYSIPERFTVLELTETTLTIKRKVDGVTITAIKN